MLASEAAWHWLLWGWAGAEPVTSNHLHRIELVSKAFPSGVLHGSSLLCILFTLFIYKEF